MDTTINITCPQSGCQISIHISVPENASDTRPTVEVVDNTRPVDSGVKPSDPVVRPVDSGVRPTQSSGRIDAPAGKNSYDISDEDKNDTPYRNVRQPRR